MAFQKSVKDIIDNYKSLFPNEGARLTHLDKYLLKVSSFHDLSNRKRFQGHITASAIIISKSTGCVLMVDKPVLGMHLQPGGHIKSDDLTPLHAAVRHMTWRLPINFVNRLIYLQWDHDPFVPMDIDSHKIPNCPQDGEPSHTHFDMRYLFLGDEEMLSEDTEEFRKHKPIWKELDYVSSIHSFEHVIRKLSISLSPELARKRFFSEVTNNIATKSVSVLAVAHIIPDIIDYLMTLNTVFDLKGVIAKPKSINEDIQTKLSSHGISINKFNRDSKELEQYLETQISNSKLPVVLIDIGGWFAPFINSLSIKFKDKLVGIVEDTENGYQKYSKLAKLPLPIYSVARSPLKDYEDYLIGESIVYSADSILRTQGILLEYLNCLVIGYGKIGKSIAKQLANRGLQPSVYDKRPTRRLEAYNRGFKLQAWTEGLSTSDIIFSATGGQAIDIINIKHIKSGSFIFSVTSSDDEFDFSFLDEEYTVEKVNQFIDKYIGKTNYFYLVCKGDAVNFIHGACVGDFIQLARSEMLCAVSSLVNNKHESKIYEVDEDKREEIADSWIRIFLRIHDVLFEQDRDQPLVERLDSFNDVEII